MPEHEHGKGHGHGHGHQHGHSPEHGHGHGHGHGPGYKFDPANVERLRDPERLQFHDPERIWEALEAGEVRALVDIGAGIGFFAIPFARHMPDGVVYACDVEPAMLAHLDEALRSAGVTNVKPVASEEVRIPLADGGGGLVVRDAAGAEKGRLAAVEVAHPCKPFTGFALRHETVPPEAFKQSLQFLDGGVRGFYCTWAGAPAVLEPGDVVARA